MGCLYTSVNSHYIDKRSGHAPVRDPTRRSAVKSRIWLALLLACACCIALAQSSFAQRTQTARADHRTPAAGAAAGAPTTGGPALGGLFVPTVLAQETAPGDPVALSGCFVSVQCADGSTRSCNGNSSCSTSGPGDCVTCDGAQQCCPPPPNCCDQCLQSYDSCLSTCDLKCNICHSAYDHCVNYCGGCP